MKRVVAPEWLDELSPQAPSACASRRDLQRLNALMGHAPIIVKVMQALFQVGTSRRDVRLHSRSPRECPTFSVISKWRRVLGWPPRAVARTAQRAIPTSEPCNHPGPTPIRLAELGCGDGTLMLRVAQELGWRGVKLMLVDLHPVISPETLRAFADLDWQAEPVIAEATEWLPRQAGLDLVIANLFLHHFEDDRLRCLLTAASQAAGAFMACEPRRSRGRELASRFLWALGANAVTRHDAPISVRAGFSGCELSKLWPARDWTTHERRAGLFTHLFIARREGA